MALWKSTIVIWTDDNPSSYEIEDLVREAVLGNAFCSKQHVEQIEEPEKDPDWYETDFFNLGKEA